MSSEPSGPSIFGRPMTRETSTMEAWSLYTEQFCAHAIVAHDPIRTRLPIRWTLGLSRDEPLLGHLGLGNVATFEEASRAIERRIRLVTMVFARLLDDATKRELVKAAGIGLEHFPECKDEAESEAEPVL